MNSFLQGCGSVLISVILILLVGKDRKDLGMLISLGACSMVLISGLQYLKPVLDFVRQLETLGNLNHNILKIALKVTGMGLLGEIAALICADTGNQSLGKALQYLTSAVILWMILPAFTLLMELIQGILGDI